MAAWIRAGDGYIRMHRGDTLTVHYELKGWKAQSGDRAVWTMRDGSGKAIMERVYEFDENNRFAVSFANGDTDSLAPGYYSYDARIVHVPVYDDSGERILDTAGGFIRTPWSPGTIELLGTVGQI